MESYKSKNSNKTKLQYSVARGKASGRTLVQTTLNFKFISHIACSTHPQEETPFTEKTSFWNHGKILSLSQISNHNNFYNK